ncbi:substrate-binding periplasmic protein [Roseateles sp. DXS20W]|uniref:Substrate-binding periplasmic protein n=1 Tax=Pelomonas lactea TaxID=3299030 RepID=A0ABW7GJE3_9BURK
MRRRLLTTLLMCMPLLAVADCARPWRVPFEDWRPYAYLDAAGQPAGLEVEMLAAVAREQGCSVEYVRHVSRNRRLHMLASGELDLLVAASYDGPNTPSLAWYTSAYRHEEFAAFMRADAARARPAPQTLAHALDDGLRLLAHRGPYVVPLVAEFERRARLTGFEDYAKGVELLSLGRGDLLLGDRLAVLYAADAAGVRVVELALPVRRDVVAYKLGRKRFDAAGLARFNEALQRLEARGELQRIRSRWLGPAASSPRPAASAARR